MLALYKIMNLVGGWTYKSKHDLDKDSDIITSSRSSKNSKSGRSSKNSRNSKSSKSSTYNTLSSFKIGYKKTRGTKKGKGKGNKTRSKRY